MMKLSRCQSCGKIVDKDIWKQLETWTCLCCDEEICVWCYPEHTKRHFHDFYPTIHDVDGNLKHGS